MEQRRVGFQTYVPQRMTGFGGESKRPGAREFNAPQAIAEIRYQDTGAIEREIERLKRLAGVVQPRFAECFMTEPSPGDHRTTMLNTHYDTHEAYLNAIAREMRREYLAVSDAGLTHR